MLTAERFLDVFEQKDADQHNRVARYPTPTGAPTGLFVPEWRKLFVAVTAQEQQNQEIPVYVT